MERLYEQIECRDIHANILSNIFDISKKINQNLEIRNICSWVPKHHPWKFHSSSVRLIVDSSFGELKQSKHKIQC
jgi:hypothetical protein